MNAPLRLQMTARINAPAEVVFDRVVQYGAFPRLNSAIESVRAEMRSSVYDFGDGLMLTEQIVEWKPPHRYVVKASDFPGMPTEHVAVVTIEDHCSDTCILCWQHYFEHPEPEQATEQIRFSVCGCINDLVVIFGGSVLES
jgi:hypothetical protein